MSEQKSKDILEAEALIAKHRAAWNDIQKATRDYEEKYWNDNKDSLQAQGYSYTKNSESPWGGVWTKQVMPQSPGVAQTATEQKSISQVNTNNVATNMVTTKGGLQMTQQELDFWTKVAQEKGFADVDAVAKWQSDNELPADGKLEKNSLDKYNSIAQANQQAAATNGQNTKAKNSIWIISNLMTGPEYEWKKANPMPKMRGPLGGGLTPEYKAWVEKYKAAKAAGFKKQGGTMNRVKYFQQGGPAPQQDIQQQVIQLVQAAMNGDEKATQTVNKIMEAAKAGDQQAAQIAQMIQQVAKQMQGQATTAKWGAKLGYIRSLKFANGGKTCPACQQGATFKKAKTFTLPNKKVEEKACGGKAKKMKKRYFGGWL